MSEKIKLNIKDCSACRSDHLDIAFVRFDGGPLWVNSEPYFWGAICPNTGETIVSNVRTPEDVDPRLSGPAGGRNTNKI